MTGKRDEAASTTPDQDARDAASPAGTWEGRMRELMEKLVEEALYDLIDCRAEPGDVLAIGRKMRVIASAARVIKIVAALKRAECATPGGTARVSQNDRKSIDPDYAERQRAELQSRIDHMHAASMRRNLGPRPAGRSAGRRAEGDAAAA